MIRRAVFLPLLIFCLSAFSPPSSLLAQDLAAENAKLKEELEASQKLNAELRRGIRVALDLARLEQQLDSSEQQMKKTQKDLSRLKELLKNEADVQKQQEIKGVIDDIEAFESKFAELKEKQKKLRGELPDLPDVLVLYDRLQVRNAVERDLASQVTALTARVAALEQELKKQKDR